MYSVNNNAPAPTSVSLMMQGRNGGSLEKGLELTAQHDGEDESMNNDEQLNKRCGRSLLGLISNIEAWIGGQLFPGMPSHFSLRKRMLIQRVSSSSWAVWDVVQVRVRAGAGV
jgi:hypothetical protein